MKTFIALLFIGISCEILQAQNVPGYYISTKRDTVHCEFVPKNKVSLFCNQKLKIIKDGEQMKLFPDEFTSIHIDSCCKIIPLKVTGKLRPATVVIEGDINLYIVMVETCIPIYVLQKGNKKPKLISKGFWKKPFLKYLDMDLSRKKDLKGMKYRDMHLAVQQFNSE